MYCSCVSPGRDLGHGDLEVGDFGGGLEHQVEAGVTDDGGVLGEDPGLEGDAVGGRTVVQS